MVCIAFLRSNSPGNARDLFWSGERQCRRYRYRHHWARHWAADAADFPHGVHFWVNPRFVSFLDYPDTCPLVFPKPFGLD